MKKFLFIPILLLMLSGCKKKETCPTCQNLGTCVEYKCQCPDNYEGEFCEKEKTPKRVWVKGIALESYPKRNGSNEWDTFSAYADPYVIVTVSTPVGISTLFESEYQDNVNPEHGAYWSTNFFLTPDMYPVMLFYDEDGEPDQLMASDLFDKIYEDGEGFPVIKTKHLDDGTIYSLILEYEF